MPRNTLMAGAAMRLVVHAMTVAVAGACGVVAALLFLGEPRPAGSV